MALISSSTLVRSMSLLHFTLAFFFLTSPKTVSDQTLVFIVGEAMKLPAAHKSFDTTSPPLAFAALLLAFLGLTDLISVSLPLSTSIAVFSAQAPLRMVLFFSTAAYSFLGSGRDLGRTFANKGYGGSAWGDGLKNRVVFTFAFVEMMVWFWVWTTLRDEKREEAVRVAEARRRREEGDMM